MTHVSPPLRVALVGTGSIAVNAHLPAWVACPGAEIVLAVDTRADAAREVATKYAIPRWTSRFEDALEDPTIEVVDLCTPAFLHASQTLDALRAGKHVIVEKPVAVTVDDAETMAIAAAAAGVKSVVAENWVYAPATRRVVDVLESGAVGAPYLLEARNESDFLLLPFARPDQTDRDRLGYAFVGGIHSLALAVYLMGDVAHVSAYANSVSADTPDALLYDTDMAIACRFTSGALGSFHFSGRSTQPRHGIRHFRVLAARGVIDFDVFAGRVEVLADGQRKLYEDFAPSAGHAETIAAFAQSVRDGTTLPTSIQSQVEVLRLLYATYASAARNGQAVDVSASRISRIRED